MPSRWPSEPSRYWACIYCFDGDGRFANRPYREARRMQDVILNTTPLPHLLTLVILLPLVGVAMMAFVKDEAAVKHVAFWTTGLGFALSLPLYLWFDPATHRMQFGEVVQWISTPPIRYAVGIDGISLWLVLLTTLLMPICVVCSWTAIKSRVREFMITLLAMETALLGVFCALDFVLFYVFWEAMLIPMYLLIGVWGGPNRIYAAIKFFLYTLAGSLLLLVAIIVLYFQGGHTFDILSLSRAQYGETLQACSSGPSSSPSPSRSPCSRSTPGCPTRTSRRPP